MSKIFYVSSQGHAATKWLADSLAMDSRIVVFHGSCTIPPCIPGDEFSIGGTKIHMRNSWTPGIGEELSRSLQLCSENTGKIFGSIHGIWGLRAKEPIEALGGKFAGIIRNPLQQFHSMMNAFTPRALSNAKKRAEVDLEVNYTYIDLINRDKKMFSIAFEARKKNFWNSRLRNKIRKIELRAKKFFDQRKIENDHSLSNAKELDVHTQNRDLFVLMDHLAISVISNMNRVFNDHQLFFKNLDEVDIIQMEKMVSQKDYFQKVSKNLTGIAPAFHENDHHGVKNHGHIHTKIKKKDFEIFQDLPDCLKREIENEMKDKALRDRYSGFGYEIF